MTVVAPPSERCATVELMALDATPTTVETDVVGVLVLPGRCWRCRQVTYPIVGVLGPGHAFRPFPDVADQLAGTLSEAALRKLGTGAIRRRRSRTRLDAYLSNGCLHCDAIQGDFPLREDLAAFRAEGGALTDLLAGQVSLPRAAST